MSWSKWTAAMWPFYFSPTSATTGGRPIRAYPATFHMEPIWCGCGPRAARSAKMWKSDSSRIEARELRLLRFQDESRSHPGQRRESRRAHRRQPARAPLHFPQIGMGMHIDPHLLHFQVAVLQNRKDVYDGFQCFLHHVGIAKRCL